MNIRLRAECENLSSPSSPEVTRPNEMVISGNWPGQLTLGCGRDYAKIRKIFLGA
jgi:hypothetical protein